MSKKDYTQAFPVLTYEYNGQANVLLFQETGMTLRDYFAAASLSGQLASQTQGECVSPQSHASRAYLIADAMIEARKA